MNQLKIEKQIMIASMLVEGNSIRSIERVTGVHRDTIMRLGIKLGEQAKEFSDKLLVNIKCNQLQIDEIWSFVGKKKKNLTSDEPKYTIIAQVESVHLVDKTSNPFIEVERDNQKYYINKERILYFKEYNKNTDEAKVKHF